MKKKVGILLIIIFSILLVLFVLTPQSYIDLIPTTIHAILIIGISIFLPFGASLIPRDLGLERRNKIRFIYLLVAIIGYFVGVLLKLEHYMGANIIMICSTLWYCFAFAPLHLKHRYNKWKPLSKSKLELIMLSHIDFIGFNLIVLGYLFKIMHWPYASMLINIGFITVIAGLLAWNIITRNIVFRRKKSEDQLKLQHQEITDSIAYAKRIQTAILPTDNQVKEHLYNSFILYKPKDVIAGDFYWLEPINNQIFFAAADCTGHGVPGAMVSVVCNNALNKSVREHQLLDPGKILDQTKSIITEEFGSSEAEISDGMDIALCKLQENELSYAGAHNPLWIIRKDSQEVDEIKADKIPIGKYHVDKPFVTHKVTLKAGDTIYIFSDGFSDQFGGIKGKKFKSPNFKKLLLSMQNENLSTQKKLLQDAFTQWQGDLEQVDDVLVIGFRYS